MFTKILSYHQRRQHFSAYIDRVAFAGTTSHSCTPRRRSTISFTNFIFRSRHDWAQRCIHGSGRPAGRVGSRFR